MSAETRLHAATARRGAKFVDEGEWRVAASFGDTAAEVAAAKTSAVVVDLSDRGFFTLGGKDGAKFVQGLTSNDVVKLADGKGCYSGFLSVLGRFETDCYVFKLGDTLVIETPAEGTAWLAKSLGRFRRAGDFRFVELAETHAALAVVGPAGASLLGRHTGVDLAAFGPYDCADVNFGGAPLRVLGVPRALVWSVDVVGETAAVESLYDALLDDSETRPAPAGADALDVLRVEAGIPRFGRDFNADAVLQEIDVPEVVSYTKGCYLGQEVVARLHYLGQPSKLVRRLVVEGGLPAPAPGDPVVAGDGDDPKDVGRVTSVVRGTDGLSVLATVKRKAYAPGTSVRVRAAGGLVGAVVASRAPEAAVDKETR